VPSGRVLDHNQIVCLELREAHFSDRLVGVGHEPFFEGRVGPGPCDNARAVLRTHFLSKDLDPAIDRGAIEQTLFNQQALQRLDPEGRVGGEMRMQLFLKCNDPLCVPGHFVVIGIVIIILIIGHGRFPRQLRQQGGPSGSCAKVGIGQCWRRYSLPPDASK
jgi:hypothetical protein